MQALSIPIIAAYPFMTRLSGIRLGVPLYVAAMLKSVLAVSVYELSLATVNIWDLRPCNTQKRTDACLSIVDQITRVTGTSLLQNNAVVRTCPPYISSQQLIIYRSPSGHRSTSNPTGRLTPWPGCYIFVFVQPQEQRGAANGIATTAMSLSKAFAPAVAGILYVRS
jgi:hypothetical protein